MKQEQKLVAEVYRYLAPFIDISKPIYLSLDGAAAKTAVTRGELQHETIPDLWFTVIGQDKPMLIEAKALDKNGRVLLMRNQLRAWRSTGNGSHRPHYWIAVNHGFDSFYLWRHDIFSPQLDKSKNKQTTASFAAPKAKVWFGSAGELALEILHATKSFA